MTSSTELDELLGFLGDRRPDLHTAALGVVKGLTATPEGLQALKSKAGTALPLLLRLVPSSNEAASRDALTALINLAQDADVVAQLLKLSAVGRLMDFVREGTAQHSAQLMMMMLCNLTASEEGCAQLLQMGQGKLEGLHMAILLKKFVMGGVLQGGGSDSEDTYAHVAAILTNVTRLKQGRELLLQPGRGLLQALASQLQAPSDLRRAGAAGALKNCCMSAEADGTVDLLLADEQVLRRMLAPLSGQEPKEANGAVREALAEAVLALAATEVGSKALWAVGAADILKKGYEYEEHPGVCRALELTAQYFIFEPGQVGEEDGQPDIATGTTDQGAPPAPKAALAPQQGSSDDAAADAATQESA